jgi:hypothetical protein
MLRRISRRFFGPLGPPSEIVLREDEEVVARGVAALVKGLHGGRWGPLILTNRRVLWYEDSPVWPLKRQSRQIQLDAIGSVDKGTWLHFVAGGRRLRLRLKNGKVVTFFDGNEEPDRIIEMIRQRISTDD